MREVVYSLTASLDGYINRLDGSLNWIARRIFQAHVQRVRCRQSYQTMLRMPGPKTYPGMTNYVVSRTLPPGKRDGLEFSQRAWSSSDIPSSSDYS